MRFQYSTYLGINNSQTWALSSKVSQEVESRLVPERDYYAARCLTGCNRVVETYVSALI